MKGMKKSILLWGMMLLILLTAACGNRKSAQDPMALPAKEDSENTGSSGIPIRIYYSDESGEPLCVSMTRTEEITPEILLLNLSFYQMVPDTASVQGFEQRKQEDGLMLMLDLSEDFETYLSGLDAAGEAAAMGSLVNTFLDAYQGSSILITVEGETLNTGHGVYSEALELYPYEEASYHVEEKKLSRNQIQISYPQIAGLSDGEAEKKWNETIRGHAEKALSEAEEGSSMEVTYSVKTMNDQMLSILIEGLYSQKDETDPARFCYTYNIDIISGESVRLAYCRDTDELAKKLLEGNGYTAEGELDWELKERLTILYGDKEQLADALRSFDYGENRETPQGFSYHEDGQIHLCIKIPHALGDYVDVILE